MKTEREQLRGKAITTRKGELNCKLWHVGSFLHLNINELWLPLQLEDIQSFFNALQYGGKLEDVEMQRHGNGNVRFVWESDNYKNGKVEVIALVADIEKELYPILKQALSPRRQQDTLEGRKHDVIAEVERQKRIKEYYEQNHQLWDDYKG